MIIVLAVGGIILPALLGLASTSLNASRGNREFMLGRYAGEAGVDEVLKDLLEGDDALAPGYTVPAPTVNDYAASVTIASPTPGTEPTGLYQYVDPGASYGLSNLGSLAHYYFRLDNIRAASNIRVNWSFSPTRQPWRVKLYTGTGPVGVPAPTTIAWDNFESGGWAGGAGWLYPWYRSGESAVVTAGTPYQGTYHLRLRGSSGYVDRALSLSGSSSVRLQFWAKAESFEPGEFATLSVSPNGTTWTTVRTWVDGDDDGVYRFEDIDLSSFTMSSEFWVAFDAEMSSTDDLLYVDDFRVVSQPIPAPVAQAQDSKGPATLLVSGSLIVGGQYTIDFFNNSGVSLASSAFSSSGGASTTWVYVKAYKDYVISSTGANATLKIFARQIPGPTYPTTGQKVYSQAWWEP